MNRFSFFSSGHGRASHDVGDGIPFSLSELRAYTDGFSKKNFVGYGGFGLVYSGTISGRMERDLNGLKIAVKVSRNKDEDRRKQWEAETHYLPSVPHKNIIKLIGSCETTDKFYLVYPYMENGNVKVHLKGLDWSRTLQIIKQTTYAIQALHAHTPSLIYRDLKPDNLLLDKGFTIKLADFGGVTSEGERFQHGTRGYTDPIILDGRPGTKASSIYSLGVLILQLIMKEDSVTIAGTDAHISDWAATKKDNNGHAMDTVLKSKGCSGKAARAITDLGLACVSQNPWVRPTIDEVLSTLKNL